MSSYSSKILSFLIVLVLFQPVFSQNTDYNWPENAEPTKNIDELGALFDALILSENHTIDLQTSNKKSITHTIHQRIKIFSELGLNESAYVYVLLDQVSNILTMDARTIKQDGRIIDLKSDDIFGSVDEEDEMLGAGGLMNHVRFAIPGVEVGDEIETFIVLEKPEFVGGDILPNSHAFSLNTKYAFMIPRGLELDYNIVNGFPAPRTSQMTFGTMAIFESQNLESILEEEYSIPYIDLPWFSFTVQPSMYYGDPGPLAEWMQIENMVKATLENSNKVKGKHAKYFREKFYRIAQPSDTKFGKFKLLYSYLVDSLEMRELQSKKEANKSNEYYFYNGFMDKLTFYKLVAQIAQKLGLKYRICFARDRYRGPINYLHPRYNEVDEFVFVIYDDKLKPYFLSMQHPITHFEIGEIPSYLSGSFAMYNSGGIARPSIDSIWFPTWGADTNLMVDILDLEIDPQNPDSSNLIIDAIAKGHASSIYRGINDLMTEDTMMMNSFLEYRRKENPDLYVDSSVLISFSKDFPFELHVRTYAGVENAFTILNDSLISIPLEELISHSNIDINTKRRKLDYYPEFQYNDSIVMTCSFPEGYKLEILNQDGLADYISNNTGSYRISLDSESNLIKLYSAYKIRTDRIPVEKIEELTEIEEAYNKGRLGSVLVKFRK